MLNQHMLVWHFLIIENEFITNLASEHSILQSCFSITFRLNNS